MSDGPAPGRKLIDTKHRIVWYIAALFSLLLYFSGFVPLYIFLRRKILKRNIAVALTYHRINDNNETPDIMVSTKNFERQMAYLKKYFDIVPIDEIVNICINNKRLRRDTAAVTFDDGYKDNFTDAYPILKKYNVPALIFVAITYINESNKLSSDEIKAVQKGHITFGAHTITHKALAALDRESAFLEVSGSKSYLEQILQEEVKYFAYPYGKRGRDFTDETMQIVKDAGYKAAFATDNGFINGASNLFALNRIGVRNFPLFVFKCRISGIFENRLFYWLRRYLKI